jgi:hypothetical protein
MLFLENFADIPEQEIGILLSVIDQADARAM